MARRAGLRRRLAQDGRALRAGRPRPGRRRCAPRPRPTPAGPASIPATACRPTGSRSCCCIARRNDIRAVAIAGGGGLGVLDFYEEVDKQIPLKGRRWVVSHINVISPRDIERIARMGLVLTTHTNAYLYKALETTASSLKPEQYDDIVPMNALARGRRHGVACDRQRADLAVVSGRADGGAQGLQDQADVRRKAGAVAHGGAALRHRERRLSDLRRGQERLARSGQISPTSPCSAPIR